MSLDVSPNPTKVMSTLLTSTVNTTSSLVTETAMVSPFIFGGLFKIDIGAEHTRASGTDVFEYGIECSGTMLAGRLEANFVDISSTAGVASAALVERATSQQFTSSSTTFNATMYPTGATRFRFNVTFWVRIASGFYTFSPRWRGATGNFMLGRHMTVEALG